MSLFAPLSGCLSPLGTSARGPRGVESEFCLGFDGVNDYIEVPHNTTLSPASVSVSMWVKLIGTPAGFDGLLMKTTSDAWNDGWGLYWEAADATLRFWVGSYVANVAFTTLASSDRNWHHVVGTYDGITVRIYLDGRQGTSDAYAGPYAPSTDPLYIGKGRGATGISTTTCIPAMIDDLYIYSRALTADEISALYNNVTAPPSDYVEAFEFEEGSGTTTTGRNGTVGTLTNGPTWQPQVPPRLIRNRETEDWSLSFTVAGTQYVAIPHVSKLDNTSKFTISAWMKRNSAGNAVVLGQGTSTTNFQSFELWSDGNAYFEFGGNGATNYGFVPNTSTAWQHVCMVFDGTQIGNANRLKGYINGAPQTLSFVGTIPPTTGTNSDQFTIGQYLASYSNGTIKDVRIIDDALPAASVAKLARGVEPDEIADHEWPLNEGTGTTAVDVRGGLNGTLTNGPTWTGDVPQWFRQAIVSTQAASFDGVDDYVSQPTNHSSDSLTVAAWVKPEFAYNQSVEYPAVIGHLDSSGEQGWTVDYPANGRRWRFYAARSLDHVVMLGPQYSSDAEFGRNAWSHVVATVSNNSGSLYINGASVATDSGSGVAIPSTATQDIGRNIGFGAGNFPYFDGAIDEVCIYNRALSAAEVADATAGYLVTAGLVSRWKLDGDAQDSVGSNHGTEQGGVDYSTSVPGTL